MVVFKEEREEKVCSSSSTSGQANFPIPSYGETIETLTKDCNV